MAMTRRPVSRRRPRLVDRLAQRRGPEAIDLTLSRMEHAGNPNAPMPRRVVLVRPDPREPSADQLFLDQVPVPRTAWRYDAHDRLLSWRGAFGGGHLRLSYDKTGGIGSVGGALRSMSVHASATAVFTCDVALNTGATRVTSGGVVTGYAWDPASAAWKSASWVAGRLQLKYTVTPGTPMQPPSMTFDFEDIQTGAVPWDPVLGSFASSLSLAEQAGRMVWALNFKSEVAPDPDQGSAPTGPDTVYPYWLQAVEDAAAASITGVLEIDAVAPNGTLVGMQGQRASALASGYYRTGADAAPFGVFDGRLVLGGQPVASSRLRGNVLSWSGLGSAHQVPTGLPESGTLRFAADGSAARSTDGALRVRRLPAASATAALAVHRDLHPQVFAASERLGQALDDSSLDIYGLLAMTPYAQNAQGAWEDQVQAAVTGDLQQIMNSFTPSNLWSLIFPESSPPTLSGELATVANSPVSGVSSPSSWYAQLGTAVFTQGLAGGSDQYCQYMNGPRAAQWLKTQVATSQVYYQHGQLLFQYEWQQQFPLTSSYLADQVQYANTPPQTGAPTYNQQIAARVAASVADINTNVAPDPTQPDLIANLITQVQGAGTYATTNNLYWAFAYYTYNTAPAVLANIALEMGINTGSADGTTLSRLFQQNVAVLTALDSSGFFARQYTQTVNIFLATNVLPSMFGFTGDATNFDAVKQYLQQFVKNNLANENQQIVAAAQQLQSIIDDENFEQMLKDSIEALNSFADATQDALALPYVANNFVKWMQATYPRFAGAASVFGSVLLGGITGLAVYSLFEGFDDWDEMTTEQKSELVTDACQLGLQVLAGVVQRGVRVYAIFGVEGMTTEARSAAIGRILLTGKAGQLDEGLVEIGNSTARWIGDTEGTIGAMGGEFGFLGPLLANDGVVAAEEASLVGKIFGRNLDEFMATRIGPVFILAGIGYSIYSIAEGDKGVPLAGDILNIVSGSLMIFSMVGEWAVASGLIVADGALASLIAFAGPLAVLAALAGVALMIYLLFHRPPDPVEQFLDNYVRPNGFGLRSRGSALDYAGQQFANPDQNGMLMIGFTLSAGGQTLTCNTNGSITLGATSTLPNCVWESSTDGLGMSQIGTVAQPDTTKPPVSLLLSLMSDGSVSFQPKGTATVTTQTWLSAVTSDAALTSDGEHMKSLNFTLQPVLPDAKGNYLPSQASGWLATTASGVTVQPSGGTTFLLQMSAMAPNYMSVRDISFILNSTPSSQEVYGPSFGVVPSTPLSFTLTPALPSFLAFDGTTGRISPNGGAATPASQAAYTLHASNGAGQLNATPFNITVATAPAPPSPATAPNMAWDTATARVV